MRFWLPLGFFVFCSLCWLYIENNRPLTPDEIRLVNNFWNPPSNTRGLKLEPKVVLSSTGAFISSPELQDAMVAILVGLTIWLIKQFLQNYFQSRIDSTYGTLMKVQLELDKHMQQCNEIPKSLIIEKIDNLTEKIDKQDTAFKEFRADMKSEINLQRARQHDLNNTIQAFIMRSTRD